MAVAAFSLVVYYTAVHLAQSRELVAKALVAADEEIDLDGVADSARGPQPLAAPA